jgi:hypothetical protein
MNSRGVMDVAFPATAIASNTGFVNRRTHACADYDKIPCK